MEGCLVLTLVLGSAAVCSDGYRGELRAVVLDPAAGTVTHLVVEPEGRSGLARLVPLALAGAAPDGVGLRCTEAEFRALAAAEETLAEFTLAYEVPVQLLPAGWRGTGGPITDGGAIPRIPERETVDVIPPGEVEEYGGEPVHASDGDIGQLRGLRVDPATGGVTHVLVREGHLLARKDVAVPFGSVAGLGDGIRLSLTRQQVRDLPADGGHSAG
jgi:sporulation protein YlmC with PRC-barrel domain